MAPGKLPGTLPGKLSAKLTRKFDARFDSRGSRAPGSPAAWRSANPRKRTSQISGGTNGGTHEDERDSTAKPSTKAPAPGRAVGPLRTGRRADRPGAGAGRRRDASDLRAAQRVS